MAITGTLTGPVAGGIGHSQSTTISVVFNESVTNFTLSDISVTNGGVVSNLTGSGTSWAFTLTAPSSGEATMSIDITGAVTGAVSGSEVPYVDSIEVEYDRLAATATYTVPTGTQTGSYTVNVTFNKSVRDHFSIARKNIYVSDGIAYDLTGSGTSWSFKVLPTKTSGTNVIAIAGKITTNVHGFVSSTPVSVPFSIANLVAANLQVIIGDIYEIHSPIKIKVVFGSSVINFTLADIFASDGAVSNLTGSGTTWYFDYTAPSTGSGSVSILIAGSVTVGGNSAVVSSNIITKKYNTPSVTATLSGPTGTQTAAYTVNVSFNKSVTGFELSDIAVYNGTASNLTGSGSSWSFTVTPPATGVGTTYIGFDDRVNEGYVGFNTLSIPYDMRPLSGTLSAPVGIQFGGYTVSVTFNKSVTNFTLSDISVTNGTASALTGGGTSWSFTVTPPNTGSGNTTIDITGQVTVVGQSVVPTVAAISVAYAQSVTTATLSTTLGTKTAPYTVSVVFGAAVTDFAISDISVTGGSVYSLIGSGTTWSFTAEPGWGAGNTVIDITGLVTSGGNTGVVTVTALSVPYTQSDISARISSSAGRGITGATSISVEFNQSVTNFELTDINVSTGVASALTGSGTTWSFTLTPPAIGNGKITIDITGSVTGAVTGAAVPNVSTYSILYGPDPSCFWTMAKYGSKINFYWESGTTIITSSFTLHDITVSGGGTLSNIIHTSYGYFQATYDAPGSGIGVVVISLTGHVRAVGTGTCKLVAEDLRIPYGSFTGTLSTSSGTKNAAYNVNVSFNVGVSGFTLSDISVTNGTASALTGGGTSWSFTVTPPNTGSGNTTIDITGQLNVTGGGRVPSVTALVVPYDQGIVTATLSAPSGTQTAAYTVSVTFGAVVTGFALSDLDITNGTASALTGSGKSYSFTLTPPATGSGNTTIDIDGDVTSGGKTGSVAVTELSAPYSQPALTGTLSVTSGTKIAAYTVTATFNQSVTNFELTDINVTNGVASNLSGSGTSWTFTVTPPLTGAGNTSIDITGNVTARGVSRVPTVTALSVPYTQPEVTGTLSVTSGTKFGAFYCFVSFSESVTGFALSDISVSAGTKSGLTGSGAGYYFTITPPSGEGTISIDITGNVTARGASKVPTVTALSVPYGEEQTVDNILWTIPDDIQQADNAAKTFSVTAAFKRDGANQAVTLAANQFTPKGISGATATHSAITNANSVTISVTVPAGKYGSLYLQLNSGAASSPTDYPGTAQFSPSILVDTRSIASDVDQDNIVWTIPDGIQEADNAAVTFTMTAAFKRNGAAQAIKLAANAFTVHGISGATATHSALVTAASTLSVSVSVPAGKKGSVYLQLDSGESSDPATYPTETQFSPTVSIDTTAVKSIPDIDNIVWTLPEGTQEADNAIKTFTITANFKRNGANQAIKLPANAFTAEGISGATATNTALTTAASSLAITVSIPAGKEGNVYLQLNSGSASEPDDFPTEAQFSPTVPVNTTAVPTDPVLWTLDPQWYNIPASIINNTEVFWDIDFGENVTGVGLADFEDFGVTNLTQKLYRRSTKTGARILHTTPATAARYYSIGVAVNLNQQGVMWISLLEDGITASNGAIGPAFSLPSPSVPYDTTPAPTPPAVFSLDPEWYSVPASIPNTTEVFFDIDMGESITGVSLADFEDFGVTNLTQKLYRRTTKTGARTLHIDASVSARYYSIGVAVNANQSGKMWISLIADSITASNTATGPALSLPSPDVPYDTNPAPTPPAQWTLDPVWYLVPASIINNTEVFFDIDFGENVTGVSLADFDDYGITNLTQKLYRRTTKTGTRTLHTTPATAAQYYSIGVQVNLNQTGTLYLLLLADAITQSNTATGPALSLQSPAVPVDTVPVPTPETPITVSFSDPPTGVQTSDYTITATFSPAISDTASEILAATELEGGGTLAIADVNRVSDTSVIFTIRVSSNQQRRIQYLEIDTDQLTKR